jgi:hypothetical protein
LKLMKTVIYLFTTPEFLESAHAKAVNANFLVNEQVFGKDLQKFLELKRKEMSEAVKGTRF